MHEVYEDHLFARGYFVADAPEGVATDASQAAGALVALGTYAEIRITAHPELATLHMVEVAARNLGRDVPEPFMRGFPRTARELSPSELLFDQLLHYFTTYGMGDFAQAGHSVFERAYERAAFAEDVELKPFAIVTPGDAEALLARDVEGFLASTRPLNDASYKVLRQYLDDHNRPVTTCACKDTVCRLLADTRDLDYADLLVLPDVLRLVEWIVEQGYPEATLKKLNLHNADRKLVAGVLDRLFARGGCDVAACLEKKRLWNGLLHHIHYRPKCDAALAFCYAIRGREARSAYSEFERLVADGDVRGAFNALTASKGQTAVVRRLAYLLSRCETDEDVSWILESLDARNKIVLIQLVTYFSLYGGSHPRTFRFVHLNKMRKHTETPEEMAKRSVLSEDVVSQAAMRLEALLADACRGTLCKVYADEGMRRIAVPIQEAASMGGFGTLPRGSRLPVPRGKKVRAFIYWEGVDDIDLRCIGIDANGGKVEFSWRTMASLQSSSITYSGDETSGFRGGSEFFDVARGLFRQEHPDIKCLVFCANVYTRGVHFDGCTCRAGFMLRDHDDSGEVYEPSTVESSFIVKSSCSSAYLFALDLEDNAFVWLNITESGDQRIAGEGDASFVLDYLHVTDVMSMHRLACLLATEVVESPEEADVVFSDAKYELEPNQEQIRSCDTPRIHELLNA